MASNCSYPVNPIVLVLLILVFQSFAFSQDIPTQSVRSFQTLYSFRGGTDGIGPNGVVLDKAGNLYGTTAAGGETSCPLNGSPGCGVVFRVNKAGKEAVLYRFSGDSPDQGGPFGSVILDAAGNLYGTTRACLCSLEQCSPWKKPGGRPSCTALRVERTGALPGQD